MPTLQQPLPVCDTEKHMEIGSLIRQLREQQGVSQRALAIRAGTSQAAVSDIERGRTSPTIDTVERLLLCLGHELDATARRLPMDASIDALRALRPVDPAERLARVAATSGLVARGRREVARQGVRA